MTTTTARARRAVSAVVAAAVGYLRSGPVASGLLVVVLIVHATLAGPVADAVAGRLSTNLDNLADHPIAALLGSVVVVPGPLLGSGLGGTLITLVLGLAGALWWFERREGSLAAAGLVAAGHVGATLLTAPVIAWAIATGRYPPETASVIDVGVSYAAQAALATATLALPRPLRPPWVLFVLGWPLLDADWFGWLPDFTTVGHLLAAGIGASVAVALRARRRPAAA